MTAYSTRQVVPIEGEGTPISAPRDRAHIDVGRESDVLWWCERFNCSEETLRDAVAIAGTRSQEVLNQLNEERRRRPAGTAGSPTNVARTLPDSGLDR